MACYRDAAFEQFARIGKALANAKRLELLDLLGHAPRTVEVLAEEAGMSVATASQHLQVLRAARLVETEKHGLYVTYRVASAEVSELLALLWTLGEHRLAELGALSRDLETVTGQRMEPGELRERLQRGEVVVLDVRPAEEYRAGHIPGAISAPDRELDGHLAGLPADREVVVYCRGRYCVLAARAAQYLRGQGVRVWCLAGGLQGWRQSGYPVESSQANAA